MMKKRVGIGIVLVLFILLASIYTAESVNKKKNEQLSRQQAAASQQVEVELYFADAKAQLIGEMRMIAKTQDLPQASIRALIAGPKGDQLTATLPKDTVLRSVTIKDGVAYVDFDGKLAKQIGAGSANELLAVYAVVDTLSAQHGINAVMILLDGKAVETLSGHLDLSQPIKKLSKTKAQADGVQKCIE